MLLSKSDLAARERFKAVIPKFSAEAPPNIGGRGIVVCGGPFRYFTNGWVSINLLRKIGCRLPIQFWHDGASPISREMEEMLAEQDVEVVDARRVAESLGVPPAVGRLIRSFSLLHCRFAEVILLDADNFAVQNPAYLFDLPEYALAGSLFWSKLESVPSSSLLWQITEIPFRPELEIDAGQILVDRIQCWQPLQLAQWLEHDEHFASLLSSSGASFRMAWHAYGCTISKPKQPPTLLQVVGGPCCSGVLCQHDFEGERLFQHRNGLPWHIFAPNPWVSGAFYEPECHQLISQLRNRWNGRSQSISIPESPVVHELLTNTWLTDRLGTENIFNSTVPDVASELTWRQKGINTGEDTTNLPLDPKIVWGELWRELRFEANGSLGAWSDHVFTLWDLHMDGPDYVLSIFGPEDSTAEITLKRVEYGIWKGHSRIHSILRDVTMESVARLYPAAKAGRVEVVCDSEIGESMRAQHGDVVHIINTTFGIGDHITSIYAATGLANQGIHVVFHTRHLKWVNRASNPYLTLTDELPLDVEREIESGAFIDLNCNYLRQLRYGGSRADWYAHNIHPKLTPCRPTKIDRTIRFERFPFKRYVIIAPCGYWKVRDWPDVHWRKLIQLLAEAGFDVIAIGGKREESGLIDICNLTTAFWVIDHPPEFIIDALLGAVAVIANDSGIAHLGGLLDIPTFAIHAQFPPSLLWSCSNVVSIAPQTRCTFCRGCADRGYHDVCNTGCSALATVSPEQVLDVLLTHINAPNSL